MIKLLFLILMILTFNSCDDKKPKANLDGKKLLKQKCASCHDLNMPPIISDDELAPPIMAVSFHMPNFMKPKDESQRIPMAIAFVTDYVLNPSLDKAYCDEESIKQYALMPSQKDNVTENEVKAIAIYMFKHYTQENLTKVQKETVAYDALVPGKKIALKYRCLGCHGITKKKVGPAFTDIANKYKDNKDEMIKSIRNGSKGEWESSNGAVMPAFEKITDQDLELLSKWVLESSS